MLQIDKLSKRFGTEGVQPVFHGVCLDLAPGECIAIMGESGVGKSTLLNCIAGLEPFDDGRIVLDDLDLGGLHEDALSRMRRRRIGFVFQAFHILPHLNLLQNVALPLWLLGLGEDEARERARGMLGRVGLAGRAEDWPAHLSGGELQRVAIARALVHRPSLVLCDEPTGNLDPERASGVLDLLIEQVREANAMAIVVTHSRLAAARTDRVLRLTRNGLHAENCAT